MIKFLIFQCRLKAAIYKAKSMHSMTKKQYYVFMWKGKPRVFSTLQIKTMKRRGVLKITWLKMQETSLFKTA